jgi:hypothetical protein
LIAFGIGADNRGQSLIGEYRDRLDKHQATDKQGNK